MSLRNNLAESDRQSLRNIYTEALQSQMVVASDSIRPSTRLYKSSYRLEVAAGLVPNADVVFTRIAFQYNRDFERLGGEPVHTVYLADLERASSLGESGWLLPDGTELWFVKR